MSLELLVFFLLFFLTSNRGKGSLWWGAPLPGATTAHIVCYHQVHIINNSLAYLFRLANNKNGKYHTKSSVWATKTKLGMCVVVDSSIIHLSSRNVHTWYSILFAYLPNIKKGKYAESIWARVTKLGMWLGVDTSTHACGLLVLMCI